MRSPPELYSAGGLLCMQTSLSGKERFDRRFGDDAD